MTTTDIEAARATLQAFQDGYTARDLSAAPAYMERLFSRRPELLVLGTGDSELMLGYEGARELVESDWQYWGALQVDVAGAEIHARGEHAWMAANATVNFTRHTSDLYERLTETVKYILDSPMPPCEQVHLINWFLSECVVEPYRGHLLGRWPLRLTAVLEKNQPGWQFAQMQFSHPWSGLFPDERLESGGTSLENYEKTRAQLSAHPHSGERSDLQAVTHALAVLAWSLLNHSDDRLETRRGLLFPSDDDLAAIGFQGPWARGLSEIQALFDDLSALGRIDLNVQGSHAVVSDDVAWITTYGTLSQSISPAAHIENLRAAMRATLEQAAPAEERLMSILRRTATVLKEADLGVVHTWPLRFMAVLTRDGDWVFRQMQFSIPAGWGPWGKVLPEVMED